jgi:hypothetical protein
MHPLASAGADMAPSAIAIAAHPYDRVEISRFMVRKRAKASLSSGANVQAA